MRINDEYVAYCLDEAVSEFIYRINNKEKPRFKDANESKTSNPGLKMLMK